MRALPLPQFGVSETVRNCIPGMKNADLKDRILDSLTQMESSSLEYHSAAKRGGTHLLEASQFVLPRVSPAEMAHAYSRRLVGSAGGKYVYAKILGDNLRVCPYCGVNRASTLDHYLPKSHYSSLALDPANLVPGCRECNHAKGDSNPDGHDAFVHPYFDRLEGRWLKAEVVETNPTSVLYSADPPASWSAELALRVTNHFKRLRLAALFGSNAAQEISGISVRLAELHSVGSAEAVREDLSGRARSWESHDPNGWQAALFNALKDSSWFCNEGVATAAIF